jgi:hypothetical protein
VPGEDTEVAGGAERGAWNDVGEGPPADLVEVNEREGKREGLGMKMGGGGCGSLRSHGTSGRAEEGAGLGDGSVRRESREGRRADGRGGEDKGRCDGCEGIRCRLYGHKYMVKGLAVISTTYGGKFTE